jgi:hypothetical protein
LLGTLFFHSQSTVAEESALVINSFEMVSNDLLPSSTLQTIQKLLFASSPESIDSNRFAFLATGKNKSAILAQSDQLKSVGIRVLDLFKNKNYQSYVNGWMTGTLKIIFSDQMEQALKNGEIGSDTILVTDKVPREIPPIAGLITLEPTAASSHVVLLAEMFVIPFAVDTKILDRAKPLNGQRVYAKLNPYSISKMIRIDQKAYGLLLQLKKRSSLSVIGDFTKTKILPIRDLNESDIPAYGGKSVRLGLIQRSTPEHAPKFGMAIPTSYFKRYLENTLTTNGVRLGDEIQTQLNSIANGKMSYAEITSRLAEIRKIIKATPVPEALVTEMRNEILNFIPPTIARVKLRSSSNVEDGNEFNGAGLYDSEGVWLNEAPADKAHDFAKGLNKVWRSFYSDRGFLARQAFGVDENNAAIGILVQETFKNEIANGVALWVPPANQWSSEQVKIVGFPGEESSVTNPTSADQPEIAMVYGNSDTASNPPKLNWQTSIEQRTNLLPLGQMVLDEKQYIELASLVKTIAEKWPGVAPKAGLDFEWKLITENNRQKILIKQVRPLVSPKQQKLSDGAKFMILGGFEESFTIDYPESTEAFGQHFCPEKMSLVMPTLTEKELNQTISIPEVKFSLRNKNYTFRDVIAKAKTWLDQGNYKYAIEFTADTDVYKNIHFKFASPDYGSDSPVLIDGYSGSVFGDANDVGLAKSFFSDVAEYRCGLASPDEFSNVEIPNEYRSVALLDAEIKLNEGTVSIKGEYPAVSGFDKTIFFVINETVIRGFGLKEPLKITVPRASVYAPAHHNFSWGLSIDLEASDLTTTEKQEFYKKFGRYLMLITKYKNGGGIQSVVVWLKPDGKMSKPVNAIWSVKH